MNARRIDVHAHFLPAFYREALIAAGLSKPDGMPKIPEWSEQSALEVMDRLGVQLAMLSISSPGVYFGDAPAARDLTERVNREGVRLRDAHPDRFGWFASTSLPDVRSAVEQATYALDVLAADGIVIETNQQGMYLGDPALEPFYATLDARQAVVFVHPTSPHCSACNSLRLGYPAPMLEFMFDTTRSITQLILSGVTVRYPNIRFIVSHAGAALPVLASRVDLLTSIFEQDKSEKSPQLRLELRKLFYDVAGAPLPELLPALLLIADVDRILYGSDWPFTPEQPCLELAEELDANAVLTPELHQKVMRGNGLALFPKLGGK